MVEGGPIDVLTGDWLAELTLLILAGNRLKGRPGYAPTFLKQVEEVLGTCLERGIRIVTNAGGLDPAGCATAVADLAAGLGLPAKVAHVTGDDLIGHDLDLINLDTGEKLTETPLTANAYLGGRPIATALSAGADIVVTGRVTDAALVTGPAQLLYEIGAPRYLGPDVVTRFDTIVLTDDGPDRVRVSGVRGEPPPDTMKVAVTYLGGYRNSMTLMLTGLDLEAKARVAQEAIWARVARESFDEVDVSFDPPLLRITVLDRDPRKAGRAFSSAVVETGLASYPGFYGLTPPGDASAYGVYWPTLVPAIEVQPQVHLDGIEITGTVGEPTADGMTSGGTPDSGTADSGTTLGGKT